MDRKPGEMPMDYARFYFMDDGDAKAFRQQWAP
jgi:hypothetical protein